MRKDRTGRTVRGLFWLLLMAGVILTIMNLLDRFPSLIQEDNVQRYESIEDAAKALGLQRKVLVPTYFPEGISWPPSLILVQRRPFRALVTEMTDAETKKTVMVIIGSSRADGNLRLERIRMIELREEVEYKLKDKSALLQVGTCVGEMPCSRITWQDNELHITALLVSSPFELIKVAESMIP